MTEGPPAQRDSPDDFDAAFEAIVAGYDAAASEPTAVSDPPEPALPGGWDDLGDEDQPPTSAAAGPSGEEERYVPPPPPPLPRTDALGTLAWFVAIGAPAAYLILAALGYVWPNWQLGLLVAGFLTGFGVLVSRMRRERGDDPDHGAVV